MKHLMMISFIAAISFASISTKAQYIDLSTGKTVTLIKDQASGYMYNTETQRPIYIYINSTSKDTFYGRTGMLINGKVTRTSEGKYSFDDGPYIYKNGEYQLMTEADMYEKRKFKNNGDVKLKNPGEKEKIYGSGDVKVKSGDGKVKMENDGVLKVKGGDYKKKIDSEGNVLEKDSIMKEKHNADGSYKVKDKDEDYKGKIDENGKTKEKQGDAKTKSKKDKDKIKDKDGKAKDKDGEVKVKTKE